MTNDSLFSSFFYKLEPTHVIVTKEFHVPVMTLMNTSDKGIWLSHWAAAMETSQISSALKYSGVHNSIIDKDIFFFFLIFPTKSGSCLKYMHTYIFIYLFIYLFEKYYTHHALTPRPCINENHQKIHLMKI